MGRQARLRDSIPIELLSVLSNTEKIGPLLYSAEDNDGGENRWFTNAGHSSTVRELSGQVAVLTDCVRTCIELIGRQSQTLAAMEHHLAAIASQVTEEVPTSLLPFEAVPDDEARKRIIAYFDNNVEKPLYPDDVAATLGLDTIQTIRICRDLATEGEIDAAR